jgi:hypothetical protein
MLVFRDAIHFTTYTFVLSDWSKFIKEIRKVLPEYNGDKKDGQMFFVGNRGSEAYVFIFLRKFDVPTLAHEAVHATNAVFDYIGSEFGLKTDEQFAYYVQWIVGTIYHNRGKALSNINGKGEGR